MDDDTLPLRVKGRKSRVSKSGRHGLRQPTSAPVVMISQSGQFRSSEVPSRIRSPSLDRPHRQERLFASFPHRHARGCVVWPAADTGRIV